MVERIGVLGGTFDPVHVGHLVAASWCLDALDLDEVLLVVANEPWQKVGARTVTSAEHRYSVVEAALGGHRGLVASRIEIERGGPSYTADTVEELLESHPEAELFLIVGTDVASELETWHRIGEVSHRVTLVVVDRGGVRTEGGPEVVRGWGGPVLHVAMPAVEVSSSELRERLASGRNVDFLIPEAAIRRIHELGLYSVGR